jgi:hypothetical protein
MSNPYSRQSIEVRYLGPTNNLGSRWVATSSSGHRLVVPQDYNLGPSGNAAAAGKALAVKLGWDRSPMFLGSTPRGYVVVFADSDCQIF